MKIDIFRRASCEIKNGAMSLPSSFFFIFHVRGLSSVAFSIVSFLFSSLSRLHRFGSSMIRNMNQPNKNVMRKYFCVCVQVIEKLFFSPNIDEFIGF